MFKKITKFKRLIILTFIIFIVLGYAVYAQLLDNNVKVESNSEIIYYLTVSYDGKDEYGVESSDTTISQVRSGYIEVEDKLPEGLTFVKFVETESDSIGAVSRSDGT